MPIGDLNKKVTIQYKSETADAMGGFTSTWNDLCQIWAAIWPVSAKETVESMQSAITISHRIRIWYRSDVKHGYRIEYGSRYFDIVSIINPNEENKWLDIMAKEIL